MKSSSRWKSAHRKMHQLYLNLLNPTTKSVVHKLINAKSLSIITSALLLSTLLFFFFLFFIQGIYEYNSELTVSNSSIDNYQLISTRFFISTKQMCAIMVYVSNFVSRSNYDSLSFWECREIEGDRGFCHVFQPEAILVILCTTT